MSSPIRHSTPPITPPGTPPSSAEKSTTFAGGSWFHDSPPRKPRVPVSVSRFFGSPSSSDSTNTSPEKSTSPARARSYASPKTPPKGSTRPYSEASMPNYDSPYSGHNPPPCATASELRAVFTHRNLDSLPTTEEKKTLDSTSRIIEQASPATTKRLQSSFVSKIEEALSPEGTYDLTRKLFELSDDRHLPVTAALFDALAALQTSPHFTTPDSSTSPYFPRRFLNIEHICSPTSKGGYHFDNKKIPLRSKLESPSGVFCASWGDKSKFSTFFPSTIEDKDALTSILLAILAEPSIARKENRSLHSAGSYMIEMLHGEDNTTKSAYPLFGYFELDTIEESKLILLARGNDTTTDIYKTKAELKQAALLSLEDKKNIRYELRDSGEIIVDIARALDIPNVTQGIYVRMCDIRESR